MPKLRILYVASEIAPFLTTSAVADSARALPQYMQEEALEVRILVPRFGVINERKNKLHEVVRLSGTNITVGDDEKALIIKVASIPSAKLQVYFIDNEDYFKRKSVFYDKDGQFFKDNDARTVFFCKGVLETVKKLEWAPDVVHCHDWMTSLIPMYLKKVYHTDPIFAKANVIFTLYNNIFSHKFGDRIADEVSMITPTGEAPASSAPTDLKNLLQIGVEYADVVTRSETLALEGTSLEGLLDGSTRTIIGHSEEGLKDYHNIYRQLAHK